jgi:hypothetical protein
VCSSPTCPPRAEASWLRLHHIQGRGRCREGLRGRAHHRRPHGGPRLPRRAAARAQMRFERLPAGAPGVIGAALRRRMAARRSTPSPACRTRRARGRASRRSSWAAWRRTPLRVRAPSSRRPRAPTATLQQVLNRRCRRRGLQVPLRAVWQDRGGPNHGGPRQRPLARLRVSGTPPLRSLAHGSLLWRPVDSGRAVRRRRRRAAGSPLPVAARLPIVYRQWTSPQRRSSRRPALEPSRQHIRSRRCGSRGPARAAPPRAAPPPRARPRSPRRSPRRNRPSTLPRPRPPPPAAL